MDTMLRKPSGLLALIFVCAVGQADAAGAADARLIGHLRLASVELVGVTNYPPTSKSRWWRPDGAALRVGPYLHHKVDDTDVGVLEGTRGVTLLIRLRLRQAEQPSHQQSGKDQSTAGTSQSAGYRRADGQSYRQGEYGRSTYDIVRPAHQFIPWGRSREVGNIARSTGPTTQSLNLFSPSWWASSVVDGSGNFTPDYYMFSAEVAASAQKAVYRVGLSKEAWQTVASWKPDEAGTLSFRSDGRPWTVTFEKAEVGATAERTNVTIKTTIIGWEAYGRLAKRLVAVTGDGSEQATPWGRGNWDSGRTIIFHLPLSSIRELRFQVSPYEWVEFRDVSLTRYRKTAPTVVSYEDPANTQK